LESLTLKFEMHNKTLYFKLRVAYYTLYL
jgi:hypothetical protein